MWGVKGLGVRCGGVCVMNIFLYNYYIKWVQNSLSLGRAMSATITAIDTTERVIGRVTHLNP